jgi:uncharacterized protein YutE (UPF0331/DUF86 family)
MKRKKKVTKKIKNISHDYSIFTAEFWAEGFSNIKFKDIYSPIDNFRFNILKSRILFITAKKIAKIWPDINEEIVSDDNSENMTLESFIEEVVAMAGTGVFTYYTYTEQALVTAVSALEVYLKDRLAYAIQNDKRLIKQFLTQKIQVDRIMNVGLNLSNDIGRLIIEDIKFQNLKEIQKLYDKVFNICVFNEEEIKELQKIIAIRNIIVHKAGIIDHMFLKQVKGKYQLDQRVFFAREEISEMIDFILKMGENIENLINKKK